MTRKRSNITLNIELIYIPYEYEFHFKLITFVNCYIIDVEHVHKSQPTPLPYGGIGDKDQSIFLF